MATTFEAILGAVHKNGGNEALIGVMTHLGLTRATDTGNVEILLLPLSSVIPLLLTCQL